MVKRVYTRVIKRVPKKKWASHIENFYLTGANFEGATISAPSIALAKSLAISNTDLVIPTPVTIKAGRFEAQIHAELNLSSAQNKNYNLYSVQFIMFFVPQGWAVDPGLTPINFGSKFNQLNNLVLSHPEWIIARRMLNDWYPTDGQQTGVFDSRTVTVKSKLQRNLQSGDQIMCALFCEKMFAGDVNYPYGLRLNASVTYKTCSN